MPLQSLNNLQLDALQTGTGAFHLQSNLRLDTALPSDILARDTASRHAQKRSNAIEHHIHLLLAQLRSLRHGLDDLLNFRYPLPQSPLQSHLHGLRRARARPARPLQLEPDHRTIDFLNPDIAAILDQVRAHLVEDEVDVLERELEQLIVGRRREDVGCVEGRDGGIEGIVAVSGSTAGGKGRDDVTILILGRHLQCRRKGG
mmetsp:Transcript_9331/g.15481  ORF Transcript_9331/g.15481 Transcript_9331/m.15481 type:complete len:202 (+) Transcript_9331:262-867(+)